MSSPAIIAAGIDSRNDVLVSLIALIGVICSVYGLAVFDVVAAIIIALFILYSGYKIGVENIDYLMGKSPSEDFIKKVKDKVIKIKGVTGINDVRAHYVGHFVQIEIHIEVKKDISTEKSHAIGKVVQRAVEGITNIDRAFVHIDPR